MLSLRHGSGLILKGEGMPEEPRGETTVDVPIVSPVSVTSGILICGILDSLGRLDF